MDKAMNSLAVQQQAKLKLEIFEIEEFAAPYYTLTRCRTQGLRWLSPKRRPPSH